MDSDDEWNDIDLVIADDTQGLSSHEPLVAAQSSEQQNRNLLLLQQNDDAAFIASVASATATSDFEKQQQQQQQTEQELAQQQAISERPELSSTPSLLATIPHRIRSLTFVGSHLHGKSSIVKDLVGPRNVMMPSAVYDAHRGLTTASYIQSGVVADSTSSSSSSSTSSSCLFTAVDCPGHPNFATELPPAILLSDCVALVVDAVEGVTATTEKHLDAVVSESVPIFLIISKIDRIMVELRISPLDCYKKLRHIIDSVNVLIQARSSSSSSSVSGSGASPQQLVSPCHGTVCFLTSKFQVALSLPIVAKRYREKFGNGVNVEWLASQLWGQITFDSSSKTFLPIASMFANQQKQKATSATNNKSNTFAPANSKPSFVQFVLEPLYKGMVLAMSSNSASAAASSQQQQSLASTTLTNLIKERVATCFGDYFENLPNVIFGAIDASYNNNNKNSSRSNTKRREEIPHIMSLLQNHFGMPSSMMNLASARGLEAAESLQKISSSSNNNNNNNFQVFGMDSASATSNNNSSSCDYSSPFGVISGKLRLEVDSGVGTKITRTFAVLKLLSGMLTATSTSSTTTNTNQTKLKLYSGPENEIETVSVKMMLLVLSRNNLMPVRKISKGCICLIDFVDVFAVEDSSTGSNNNNNNNNSKSIVSSLQVPSLLLPEDCPALSSNNEQHQQQELLPVQRRRDVSQLLHTKIAIQSKNIKETSKLRDVLTTISSERAGLAFDDSDAGAFVLAGVGEVQLDAVLFDIRKHLPVRVTHPFTAFSETIANNIPHGIIRRHREQGFSSFMTAYASPLRNSTTDKISRGIFYDSSASSNSHNVKRHQVFNVLRDECNWDLVDCDTFVGVVGGGGGSSSSGGGGNVSSSSSSSGGDQGNSCCLLFADGKSSSQQQESNNNIYRWASHGFGTTAKSGPLCGEPVRGVRFTLVDVPEQTDRASVVNGTRRLAVKTLMAASPRLMEPVMEVHVMLPQSRIEQVSEMIQKRRGTVLNESPIPATTWTVLKGLIPLMESFGFETAVRVGAEGDCYPMLNFHDWQPVPGNPLDFSLRISPYEQASGVQLARDFVVKTRKRKGMADIIDLV